MRMDWTHPSIKALGVTNPESHIVAKARQMVFHALQEGWSGPPFDPIALAEMHGVETVPSAEVLDARVVPAANRSLRIEFNPDRPPTRIRFSICHEIAHTLFPDCRETVRNRDPHSSLTGDSWQLEALCNRAAAEFLLPVGSLEEHLRTPVTIEDVLELRKKYAASSEAVLLRISAMSTEPLFVFAAKLDRASGRYLLEYTINTPFLNARFPTGMLLPAASVLNDCTAIGYTTKGSEQWKPVGAVDLECLGVPGYPGEVVPRVLGIGRIPGEGFTRPTSIKFVRGDATRPHGAGQKHILQLVNDEASTWGRGFPLAVRTKWPKAQSEFTNAVRQEEQLLTLGNIITSRLDDTTQLVSVVAQQGYGRSPKPRIRYGALAEALAKAASYARANNASIHMPRIGTGESGGSWLVVEELIRQTVLAQGVAVTVYDLNKGGQAKQPLLN